MTTTAPSDPSEDRSQEWSAKIAALRAELEATSEKDRRAILLYEIGHAQEQLKGTQAAAVRDYLQAFNYDPTFRPPLWALISLFERRGSFRNLARLYEAEQTSATDETAAARAQADHAVLLSGQLAKPTESLELLKAAHARAPDADDIALLLEYELLARGDVESALKVIEERAALVQDPVLAALLRLEVSRDLEKRGELDAAMAQLREALASNAARWRVLSQLARLAQRRGRAAELVVALEGKAKLSAAGAAGEEVGQESGAFSMPRFEDQNRARTQSMIFMREAARLRAARMNDTPGGIRNYSEAIELSGDDPDPLLLYERMLVAELDADPLAAAKDAERLLAANLDARFASALSFRLAEAAQAQGDFPNALARMRDALGADPSSAIVNATLEDLLRGAGDYRNLIAQLEDQAARFSGRSRARRQWEAAHVATELLGDMAEGSRLFEAAAESAPDSTPILREYFAATLRAGDAVAARRAVELLLERELDDREHSALLRDWHELLRAVLEDHDAADAALKKALATRLAGDWAPDIARVHGATRRNFDLLAQAQLSLAERATDVETSAAHLCAAARAEVRAGKDDRAVEHLQAALERSPNHSYALTLLEEVLTRRGDADKLVTLLREIAERSGTEGLAALMAAGGSAEAVADWAKAAATYRDAARREPESPAPWLALLRIANAQNDSESRTEALSRLSELERGAGLPDFHTLSLAEQLEFVEGDPKRATEALLPLCNDGEGSVRTAATAHLATMRGVDSAARTKALEELVGPTEGPLRLALLRVLAGDAISEGAEAIASKAIAELRGGMPGDFWTQLAWLRLVGRRAFESRTPSSQGGEPSVEEPDSSATAQRVGPEVRSLERAKAWAEVGRATDCAKAGRGLLLGALRIATLSAGEEGSDEGVLLAHEVENAAPGSLEAAIAMDEALSVGDDAQRRVEALTAWSAWAGDVGRASLSCALGRAEAEAGRPAEALKHLLKVAAENPDDLASWEAVRVVARQCEAWAPLVEACDRLAHLVNDFELAVLLLEESGAVLMDELNEPGRAERRLRRVLAIDGTRDIAYHRLHQLVSARGDDSELLALVTGRIEAYDPNTPARAEPLYEQARLLRGLGLREEARLAIENLLTLEREHVGGIALLSELNVQAGDFEGAVSALERLASLDSVPDDQRRVARLGAADFLEAKLHRPQAALEQLRHIATLGVATISDFERMAALASSLDQVDEAIQFLGRAVGGATVADEVARLELKTATLHRDRRNDRAAAVSALKRARAADPTHLEAASALAELSLDAERIELSGDFERSVRMARLAANPLDEGALRSLCAAARWRKDTGLRHAVLTTLSHMEWASDDERQELAHVEQGLVGRQLVGTLDAAAFDALRSRGDDGPVRVLASALDEALTEVDGIHPSGLGVSRGQIVRGDHPLSEELRVIGAAFGITNADLFIGGAPTQLELVPRYKNRVAWVVGPQVVAPLSPANRFEAGRLAAGLRLGVTPFVRRRPAEAVAALSAAAHAGGIGLGHGQVDADLSRRLYKAMPRRVRKSLPDLCRPIIDPMALSAWARALHRSVANAGLLVGGNIFVALRRVLDNRTVQPQAVREDEDATDLIRFWISPEASALRRQLGATP